MFTKDRERIESSKKQVKRNELDQTLPIRLELDQNCFTNIVVYAESEDLAMKAVSDKVFET